MRLWFKVFIGLIFLILVFPMFLDSGTLKVVSTLVFGWLAFLQRTVPKLTWNWDLVGLALFSVAMILFLAHKLLKGLSSSIALKRQTFWIWPWRWTWCSLTTVILFFLVGMAIGGAVHQIGWITASPEPLFERRSFRFVAVNEMKQLDLGFRLASGDADGNLTEVRKVLINHEDDYFGRFPGLHLMLQEYHLNVVVDEKNTVVGTIIFPRDAEIREHSGGICSLEEEGVFYPAKKIPELLQKYKGQLIAL